MSQLPFALIAMGSLVAGSMLVYLQACRWASIDVIPACRQRRVVRWRRLAPPLIVAALFLVALGAALAPLTL